MDNTIIYLLIIQLSYFQIATLLQTHFDQSD